MTYEGKRHFSEQLFQKFIATMLYEGSNCISILIIENIAKLLYNKKWLKSLISYINVGKKALWKSHSIYSC